MSIANVGPGFDHFGLCLERPCDILEAWPSHSASITVRGDPSLPTKPDQNVATIAARSFATALGKPWTARVHLVKGCPGGSGLGSSGASAVAGALAAAIVFGQDPGQSETAAAVLHAAADGEAGASGDPHLDNVSASLFGGFTIVEELEPPTIHRLPVPSNFRAVVSLPALRIETRSARTLVPQQLPRTDALENIAHASSLVHGMLTGNLEQVGRNLVDRIAEPYRRAVMPDGEAVRSAALRTGALGVGLSGSGPAIWAIARPGQASRVARAMQRAWKEGAIKSTTLVVRAGGGATVVARR